MHLFCINDSILRIDRLGDDNWGPPAPWGGGNQNAPPHSAISPPPYPFNDPGRDGLMVDRDELIKELVSMCPINMITAWKTVCCMDDCVTEATNIANAIYDAVKKNQTLAHGCFGNLLNTATGGHFAHGCLEWQEIVLQGYREGIRRNNHGRPKCFLSAGVAEFYPFTDWTRHNWVIIYGPNVPTVLSKDLIAEPGIHVDPWPSGGSGLFPEKPRPIDAILLPPEV